MRKDEEQAERRDCSDPLREIPGPSHHAHAPGVAQQVSQRDVDARLLAVFTHDLKGLPLWRRSALSTSSHRLGSPLHFKPCEFVS